MRRELALPVLQEIVLNEPAMDVSPWIVIVPVAVVMGVVLMWFEVRETFEVRVATLGSPGEISGIRTDRLEFGFRLLTPECSVCAMARVD